MSEIVKLLYQETGFKPECYPNWDSYISTVNKSILQHDLYEHQPWEEGGYENELRAIGAHLKYNNQNFNACVRYAGNFSYTLQDRAINHHVRGLETDFSVKKIVNLCVKNLKLEYPNYFIDKLTEGFRYAQNYENKAYRRTRLIDFGLLHKEKRNIIFDKTEGKVLGLE